MFINTHGMIKAFLVSLYRSNDVLFRNWITNLGAAYAKEFTVECIGCQGRCCGGGTICNAF